MYQTSEQLENVHTSTEHPNSDVKVPNRNKCNTKAAIFTYTCQSRCTHKPNTTRNLQQGSLFYPDFVDRRVHQLLCLTFWLRRRETRTFISLCNRRFDTCSASLRTWTPKAYGFAV